jgi:pimeloyl-ACP methyl ester carboxylesterase
MKIITITGWGQKENALDEFASGLGEVTNIPYVNYSGIKELYKKIDQIEECDLLIGWSLGAQLATRLVADGKLSPKLLVLLAPPFQYVSDDNIKDGIHPFAFSTFKAAYSAFPSNTIRKFGIMVCQNDDHAMSIIETMDDNKNHHKSWIKWLDVLAGFSCNNINFEKFPHTVIFHGDGDTITPVTQGKLFHEAIKDSRLEILEHCGHAPHLHAPDYVSKVIKEELGDATLKR